MERSIWVSERSGKHGQGTFTYPRGKYVGEFRKGRQFNTTLYDKDGNFFGRYVNGVRH